MIKILLDPQIFNNQTFGGISRQYTEIYKHLDQNEDVLVQCPIFYTDNIYYKESELFRGTYQQNQDFKIRYSQIFRNYLPKKLKKKNLKETVKQLKAQTSEVFIPTYYDLYFLDALGQTPFVLTVYDMIHELFPKYFAGDKFTASSKKLLLEKATKIIAISQNTKDDILRIYPHIEASKIEIVYLASSIKLDDTSPPNLPENYLLFVGHRSLYKNFSFFIQAVAPILTTYPDLVVLCAGGPQFTEEECQLIGELGIKKQVVQQDFEDVHLASYYKNANCFIFPSEYEGFGLPVLEAMISQCPVVLPKHSSFPEVAGEAGVYFELNNAEDLRKKIYGLLKDPESRQHYIKKGLEQATKFSWEKTTLGYLNTCKQAIQQSS